MVIFSWSLAFVCIIVLYSFSHTTISYKNNSQNHTSDYVKHQILHLHFIVMELRNQSPQSLSSIYIHHYSINMRKYLYSIIKMKFINVIIRYFSQEPGIICHCIHCTLPWYILELDFSLQHHHEDHFPCFNIWNYLPH